MPHWLNALIQLHATGTPCVLVTVASVQGSVPRGAGAHMVFSATQQFDTIGGGHLEWRAAHIARSMLSDTNHATNTKATTLERIALGPSLGQCCGGVVLLTFEHIGTATNNADISIYLEQCQKTDMDVWRIVPLDHVSPSLLYDINGKPCRAEDRHHHDANTLLPLLNEATTTHIGQDSQGQRWLLDLCRTRHAWPQVALFGAGHVGTALVMLLSTLPCRVLWIDEREDMFPATLADNITIEATDVPNAAVDMADPGAYFLVMTHSHALDQQLTERILRRADIGWFGLIGSQTKRKQFEHRLQERGYTTEQLNKIVCPIGIPGIYGKEPASIALAVAAQLLQLWELRAARQVTPPTSHKAMPHKII